MIAFESLEQNLVVVGSRERIVEELRKVCEGKCLYHEVVDFEIGVDQVREVRRWIVSVGGERAVVALSSFYWNEEAQNALLKILEDTPEGCTIVLVGHKKSFFLPTILSRVQVLEFSTDDIYQKLAASLLTQPAYIRLQDNKLKKVLAQKVLSSDDTSERNDREAQILLFESLFGLVIRDWRKNRDRYTKEEIERLRTLAETIYGYGGNPTLAIEYLLLTVPQM
jgi:hypothetical protein